MNSGHWPSLQANRSLVSRRNVWPDNLVGCPIVKQSEPSPLSISSTVPELGLLGEILHSSYGVAASVTGFQVVRGNSPAATTTAQLPSIRLQVRFAPIMSTSLQYVPWML